MKTSVSALLLLALSLAPAGARDAQVRDQQARDPQVRDPQVRDRQSPAGAGAIAGTILSDEATPQPVRGAQVILRSADFGTTKTTYTDSSGRFSIAGLAANRYTLQASKAGWVRMSYGARATDRPGTPITLADGQQLTGISLRLRRGGVIAGTIVDEHGLPAFGARVRVMQYRMQQGQRVLAPVVAGGALGEAADDRGMYRIYGLPPGEFVVTATPRFTIAGEVQAMTDAEIRDALLALQQPSQPQQPGATAGTAPATPPPARESGTTVAYAPVFYPGTTMPASAATVTLGAGEERAGVDFALQLVRTTKVEGTISGPAGVPLQGVQLMMVPRGEAGLTMLAGPMMLSRAVPTAEGKFSYTAVPPGEYTIMARVAQAAGGRGGGGRSTFSFSARSEGGENVMTIGGDGPAYWAQADVTVDGQPVSDVGLTLQPGMNLSGRIEFRGTHAIPPADLTRVRVTMLPAGTPGVTNIMMGVPAAQVDAKGGFTFDGVTPGRYRISATVPAAAGSGPGPRWVLESVVVKGRDVLDFPLEIAPNDAIADALVTFTDATQEVAGSLQDPSGRPAPDYTIVVFPAEEQFWGVARRLRTTRPGTDGKFTVTGLPPGRYRIAAVVDIAPSEANDPRFLEQLVPASYEFTLAKGEKKVQDMRIAGVP